MGDKTLMFSLCHAITDSVKSFISVDTISEMAEMTSGGSSLLSPGASILKSAHC